MRGGDGSRCGLRCDEWEEQGQRIGEEGMVALAVEDTFPESLLASIDYLKEERGAQGVALVGANATPQGFKGSPTAGMIEEALTK